MHLWHKIASLIVLALSVLGCSEAGNVGGESTLAECNDNVDNDNDDLTDCEDAGCSGRSICGAADTSLDTTTESAFSTDTGDISTDSVHDSSTVDTAGDSDTTDITKIVWINIPGGVFTMGGDYGNVASQLPAHTVNVPAFQMTRTEITVHQYKQCVDDGACTNPSGLSSICSPDRGGNWDAEEYENHPVNCVSWSQAVEYCDWLGARLPSEAEWEYAARNAGQDISHPWEDDLIEPLNTEEASCDYAVIDNIDIQYGKGCGTGRTWEVCSKLAGNTEQGLCDMIGNIREWVQDAWHENYEGAPLDGSAWMDNPDSQYGDTDCYIQRGGMFGEIPGTCHALFRSTVSNVNDDVFWQAGMRCARDAP